MHHKMENLDCHQHLGINLLTVKVGPIRRPVTSLKLLALYLYDSKILIFKGMNRSRNSTTAGDKISWLTLTYRHHGGVAE